MTLPADFEETLLESDSGIRLLKLLENRVSPLGVSDLARLRKEFGKEFTEAALRISQSRRKAMGKLPFAEKLWLDSVRVEQATHLQIAAHKAKRFTGKPVIDVCCGVGGDTFSLASVACELFAMDRDRDTLRRLGYNLKVLGLDQKVQIVQADALRLCFESQWHIHVDPDRRASNRQARPSFDIASYQPGPEVLLNLMKEYPGGAVKLSPASDFAGFQRFAADHGLHTEVELFSFNGECREATLWFGNLAQSDRRSATLLPCGYRFSGHGRQADLASSIAPIQAGSTLLETDPALIRSGLASEFAENITALPVVSDFSFLKVPEKYDQNHILQPMTCFEVLDHCAADRRAILEMLGRLGWKQIVVKTRGQLTAQQLHQWLRSNPTGLTDETLLVWTMKGQDSYAVAAKRIRK